MKTKTIDVNAKEWFDKINGNSYFSGTITLNYLLDNEETFLMPFQYGYGSQYEDEAKAILTQFNKISGNWFQGLYTYCKDNNIKWLCKSSNDIILQSKLLTLPMLQDSFWLWAAK